MITVVFRKKQQKYKAIFKTGFACHPEIFPVSCFTYLLLNNEPFLAINDSLR